MRSRTNQVRGEVDGSEQAQYLLSGSPILER